MQQSAANMLIVDDDALFREATRLVLQVAGFHVAEAGGGDEALRLLRTQPYDLILCDMYMPGRDGLEMIRALRSEFPQAKIIATSGGSTSGRVDVLRVALHLGASEVLRKPFDQATLLATVQRLIC